MAKLRRRLTHALVVKIVREQKPRGWRILEREGASDPVDGARETAGQCHFDGKIISVEPITDIFGLATLLHEIAHAKFHARKSLPEHAEEFEAERWSFTVLRRYGLRVPTSVRELARTNVSRRIAADRKSNVKIEPRVARWASYKPTLR